MSVARFAAPAFLCQSKLPISRRARLFVAPQAFIESIQLIRRLTSYQGFLRVIVAMKRAAPAAQRVVDSKREGSGLCGGFGGPPQAFAAVCEVIAHGCARRLRIAPANGVDDILVLAHEPLDEHGRRIA